MSQPPNQPYSGQPDPGQPGYSDQSGYPGQAGYSGQPGYPAQPGQPGYNAQPGQPGHSAQPGQPGYNAQPGQPGYSGQPGYPAQPDQPGYAGPPGYASQPDQPGYASQPRYAGQPGQSEPPQPWSSPPGPDQPYSGQSNYPGQSSYPGQPNPAPPNPDVPSSVPPQPGYPAQQQGYPQPAYPQSGYPQPDYPQPGYPQSGYPPPGFPPSAPKKKSRALPIVLVSIGLVLVLCIGGGTAVYLAGRNTAQGIADAITSAAPTEPTQPTRPTRPTETATPTATISIVEPKTLGGRPKVTDPAFAAQVEQLESSLALVPGATQAVGALYGTPSKQDLVVVVAAKTRVADPKDELDSAFTGSGVASLNLTGVSSIPAGPLGGVAKCAKGNAGGAPLVMCAWADEGSSGSVFWYFTSLSKAKKEFVKLRGQIEKKSN